MIFENRADYDLAFLLRYENIAWYEDGVVEILNRTVYPREIRKVRCYSYTDVVKAIKDMVTQSEGPYIAACHGLVLACFECEAKNIIDRKSYIEKAAYELTHARPTTKAQMKRVIKGCLDKALYCIENNIKGQPFIDEVNKAAFEFQNNNYKRYSIIGKKMAEVIPDNSTVLTQCFGGTVVGTMLRALKEMGKNIKVVCCETRPFYQGSRLTASVAKDMGFDVTVICDNMPGFMISQNKIDVFTSASDVITMDGHVINKVGTFQIAHICKAFNIPYYVTGTPDIDHKDLSSIKIEERDPSQVLSSLDTKITLEGVKGYYPAFDITPPELVTGVVTELGIYNADELNKYFGDGGY